MSEPSRAVRALRRPCGRADRYGAASSRAGITLIELLVALGLFLVVLSSMFAVLVPSLRVQRTAETQSLRIQETESVVHLINYEVGLAGYTGTQGPQTFTDETAATIAVTLGGESGSDAIRIRFFEDPDYLAPGDTGERSVEYDIDAARRSLVRRDVTTGAAEELVGGVDRLTIVAFIGRAREIISPAEVIASGASVLPPEIAGVRVSVMFDDGNEWTFLVGLYNRQTVSVTGAG